MDLRLIFSAAPFVVTKSAKQVVSSSVCWQGGCVNPFLHQNHSHFCSSEMLKKNTYTVHVVDCWLLHTLRLCGRETSSSKAARHSKVALSLVFHVVGRLQELQELHPNMLDGCWLEQPKWMQQGGLRGIYEVTWFWFHANHHFPHVSLHHFASNSLSIHHFQVFLVLDPEGNLPICMTCMLYLCE